MSSDQTELPASPPQFRFLPPTASAEPAGFGGGTPAQALCSGSLPHRRAGRRGMSAGVDAASGVGAAGSTDSQPGRASERWACLPGSEGSSGKWSVRAHLEQWSQGVRKKPQGAW